ncbi:MAG TPA: 30S ribosomal protein S6 [Deltaproteobacteria bacterium]|jgi:small subunit ribosomal protein S6|nr:30S ribosomal protein S6 [Deltaproteobacteria bacterium]HOI06519.1 30S ribosomal protein S6 [Deltaproteobacteria bacterium]
MNLYEIMFIQNPDIGEEEQQKLITRVTSTVAKNGGEVVRLDDQGIRSMAYKIEKHSRGRYFLGYLEGPGSMIPEIERNLRIDENVMRFVIIKLDRHVTREDLLPKPAPETTEPEAQPQTTEGGE